ncbi:MAG TPA: OmpA family protein [Polyangiaceae bacterium]|nr:OmpA family protein [Polyangiaceae bacterium]
MRTRYRVRALVTSLSIFSLLVGFVGCAQPVAFKGRNAISVAGEPPPPPPPEPPPPPPEPPKPPPRVEVRDDKIEIREKIQFEYNKDIIREVSYDLLAEIADVIKKHPHIKKIRIEGHASAEGEDNYNKALSDRRAKSVMRHLVERGGIPGEMLIAKGYGEEHPVAPNDTEENREKNRRVEFNIVEQDITKKKVEIDAATGQEKIVEETKQRIKAPDADDRGVETETTKGATTSATKPAAKPATKPAAKPAAKPVAKPAAKPAAKSAAKPGAKPAKKK